MTVLNSSSTCAADMILLPRWRSAELKVALPSSAAGTDTQKKPWAFSPYPTHTAGSGRDEAVHMEHKFPVCLHLIQKGSSVHPA
jgi:hypothetical protein